MFSKENISSALNCLQSNKQKWAHLPLEKKIYYLQSAKNNLLSQGKYWAEASAMAKGIDLNSDLLGQEWLAGPYVLMRNLTILAENLSSSYLFNEKYIKKINDQFIVQVLPTNLYESILWRNFSAEIWIQKGKPASRMSCIQTSSLEGQVCYILGAGNVSSIALLDAVYKLYNEGSVCLVKLNPVNDYLLDFYNRIFSHLINDGFLKFIKTDNETSSWLCQNELVNEVHITGSNNTHDAIVWGDKNEEETKQRREKNTPKLTKKITSELGCVSPVIVVPGNWSECELKFHAKQIVSMVENNASFNCNAAKVLVLCQQWHQKDQFLNYLRLEFKKCSLRKAYYPGAKERYNSFLKNYPQAEEFGEKSEDTLPWLFIPNVNTNENEMALNIEAFCGILAEVSLDSYGIKDFFNKVVTFCNEKLWGTLSCSILIHPKEEKEFKNEFEQTLARLRYGDIGVNCWAALAFTLGVTAWGAYPGHSLQDIKSGIGTVHNTFMFDYPEKSIVRAPFKIWPKPLWFYDRKNLKLIAQKLFQFEYSKTFSDFMKFIISCL